MGQAVPCDPVQMLVPYNLLTPFLGQVGETYEDIEQANQFLLKEVHQAGTHVMVNVKAWLGKRIDAFPYLKLQVFLALALDLKQDL